MFTIEKIIGRNIGPYKKLDFDVRNRGLTLVLGEVEGEEGMDSNGAGKTMAFDIMNWILFDQTTKDISKDEMLRDGADGGYGKLLTKLDGKRLKIIRGRKHKKYKNHLWVWLDGQDERKSTDAKTREHLCKLIGYNFISFTNSTFFPQEGMNFFAALTDSERKHLLEQILGLEKIREARKRAADDKKNINKELTGVRSELSRLLSTLKEVEETKERMRRMHKNWVKEFKESKTRREDELRDAKKKRKKIKAKIKEFKETDVSKLNVKKANIVQDHLKIKNGLRKLTQKVADSSAYVRHISTQYAEIGAEFTELTKKKPVCPKCKRAFKSKKELKKLKEKTRKQLRTYEKELDSAEREEAALKTKHDEHEKSLEALDEKLEKINKRIRKAEKKNNRLEIYKERLVTVRETIKRLTKELDEMVNEEPPFKKILSNQKNKEKKAKKELGKFQKQERRLKRNLKYAEFWEHGFGDSGLKNVLLDNALKFLEEEITNILSQVTHGIFSVSISPVQKLKTKKDGALPKRMKINFEIQRGTKRRTYKQLSGGQRKRINIAALLALRKLSFLGSGHPTNILILDEILTSLDKKGVALVYDILTESDIESIFLISHKELSTAGFDSILTAKYKNDISTLEVA